MGTKEPLLLYKGNPAHNWKKFKQKWQNYELATGVSDKDDSSDR